MKMKSFLPVLIICLLFLVTACYNDNEYDLYPFSATQCDSTNVTYAGTIAPIVSANCNICHSASLASGSVITDNYDDLRVIVDNGKLWGAVNWQSGFSQMPKGSAKLSTCDLGKIKKWLNSGSPNN